MPICFKNMNSHIFIKAKYIQMTGKLIAIFLFLKRILKTGYIKPRLYVYKYLLWLHNQFHR